MNIFKKLAVVCFMALFSIAVNANPLKLRIWVGFNPGGPDDLIAREIQQQILAEDPTATVVIEYASGAGGVVAMNKVATMPQTEFVEILAGGGSNLLVATYLTKANKLVDLDKDIKILTPILKSQLVLISGKETGITSVKSLKEISKTRTLKYASIGVGSMTYLTSAYLLKGLDITAVNIPYQGMSQYYPDLITGRIDYAIDFVISGSAKVNSNIVVPIGVTGEQRSMLMPDVPTLKEQGISTFPITPWTAWFVNSRVSDSDVSRLRKLFAKILSNQDNINKFRKLGAITYTADDIANADRWYDSQKKIFKKELKNFEEVNVK
jgi:tripartite-type tricarboxylate transporter receptor subunit TctC